MEDIWYKLDNAAKIYPAIREGNWAPVFRIDAVLKDKVNPEVLQSALLITYKRFPTFSVYISKGIFWYYFEPNESIPEVRIENNYPASPFINEEDKGYLFRVLYYSRRISLEVFHSISDGFGASVFLKTLIFNYFMIINKNEPVTNPLYLEQYGILYYKDLPIPEELEDSFLHYALGNKELKFKESPAYKIPGRKIKKNTLKVIHIILNVKDLNTLAKKFDTTITEFLTSLLIYSIFNSRIYSATEKRPIKISVPINLRRRFPSKTLRNFSSYINIEVFQLKENKEVDFREICDEVRNQIREGTKVEVLRSKFSGNVQTEKNFAMRVVPLFAKNIAMKTGYSLYGERVTTSTLSNVGNIILPENIADMVERFDFLLGAPKENAFNCAVISYKDIISISFTSIILENTVIKRFVDYLVEYGMDVKVETNF